MDVQVTEDDLRKKEAKGVNIYGEKLENPQAAVSCPSSSS